MSEAAEWSAFSQCFAELGVNLLGVVTMARPVHSTTFTSPRPSEAGLHAYPVLVDNNDSFSKSFRVLRHFPFLPNKFLLRMPFLQVVV